MPHNAPASWSLALGLFSMPLLWLFWPASPALAVAAIAFGVVGIRDARHRGGGGLTRAGFGIFYAVLTLAALAFVLVLASTQDTAGR